MLKKRFGYICTRYLMFIRVKLPIIVNNKKLRILIAPLDWGLGHFTRCIPIIDHLLSQNIEVFFAGNASQIKNIKSYYNSIKTLELEGYNIRYSKSKWNFMWTLLGQTFRVIKTIKQESQWLKEIVEQNKIDAVISDNRYGLYNASIPCIIITHQLQILSGKGKWADKLLLKINYKLIHKFSQCWVVDTNEGTGLSGKLGHPESLPKIPTKYIGLLSAMKYKEPPKTIEDKNLILILLSGVEPQRSILSDKLWKKAIKTDKKIIFVEGSESAKTPQEIPQNISYHKRLNHQDILVAMNKATVVICRSGYSSIMDIIALQKKSIIIPTPGQTEQEYLARYLSKKRICMTISQNKIDIHTVLLNASLFQYNTSHNFDKEFGTYKDKLNTWIKELTLESKKF